MGAGKKLDTYLDGWRLCQAELSLSVITSEFHHGDPNTGRINCDGFVDFMEVFKADTAALNHGLIGTAFRSYSVIVVEENTRPATAWCWWQATGTSLQRAVFIRFDVSGILSKRITYLSKLP